MCLLLACLACVCALQKSERKTTTTTTTEPVKANIEKQNYSSAQYSNSNNSPKIDSKHSWNPWLHVNHIECARVCVRTYKFVCYLHSKWLLTLVGFVLFLMVQTTKTKKNSQADGMNVRALREFVCVVNQSMVWWIGTYFNRMRYVCELEWMCACVHSVWNFDIHSTTTHTNEKQCEVYAAAPIVHYWTKI